MSAPKFINASELNYTEKTYSNICTAKCSLTLNYLPNNTATVSSTQLLIEGLFLNTTDTSFLNTLSFTPLVDNSNNTETLSNIYIGGNTSNPYSLQKISFVYPPLNNYYDGTTPTSIIGEIYIQHVYLNDYAYIIIPITISASPSTSIDDFDNNVLNILNGTSKSGSINLYNLFNTIQKSYTSNSSIYPYFKWKSTNISSVESTDLNSLPNTTYFLINPMCAVSLSKTSQYLIKTILKLNISISLETTYAYTDAKNKSTSSVLASTDTFNIINNNPTSDSSDSPYYMVCQASNYSEGTTPVTVKPTSLIQQMINDSQSYLNSKFMNTIDTTIWNILFNIVLTVVIIVFLIYLFTKLGDYVNKHKNDSE